MDTAKLSKTEKITAAFNGLIQYSLQHPQDANLPVLWQQLDQVLERLPQDLVLAIAGDAIVQLVEICAARAELLLGDWQYQYDPPAIDLEEPVLTDDLLAGFLRHTMSLNLEELLEEDEPQQRNRQAQAEDSVVGEVEKTVVLEMLDQMELKQTALTVAYEESISEWSTVVRQWIETQPQPIDLETILLNVGLSPVRVWLGLLLATPGYCWEHHWESAEAFYAPANARCSIDISEK